MIFMIMTTGLIVSFFALIFLYIDSIEGYKQQDKYILRQYKIEFKNTDIRAIIGFVDDIVIQSSLPDLERLSIHTYIRDGDYILTGFYGSNIRSEYAIEVGKSFDENTMAKNPVLVSNVLLNPDEFMNIENARFKILGKEYQVIGAGLFGPDSQIRNAVNSLREVIIPYSAFKEIAPDCSVVDVHFNRPPSSEERDWFVSEFYKRFPSEKLVVPLPGEEQHTGDIYFTFFIISLGIGLSLVNVVALFRYWIERNCKKYYTYKLCGASELWVYGLVTCELMIVSIFAFLVALLIYFQCVPIFIAKDYLYYLLGWEKALVALGVSALLAFIIVHPTARKLAQMTPQEVRPW